MICCGYGMDARERVIEKNTDELRLSVTSSHWQQALNPSTWLKPVPLSERSRSSSSVAMLP